LALLRALRPPVGLLALPVALLALDLPAAREGAMSGPEQRPVSPRVCENCGGPLPAGAHPTRRNCSRSCKEAVYRRRRRERRREEARERPAKRLPRAAQPRDTDRIAASLAARERAIITTWRDRS